MLSGDRGIVAALSGCLILATVGLWDHQQSLNYAEENGYPRYQHTAQEPSAPEIITVIPKPKALEYREPCKSPKGRDESDLCAQWRAAKAAENGALWAKRGFWITVVGAFGLFFTIIQGRYALRRASEANRIAQTQFEMAHRPWLSVVVGPGYIDESKTPITRLEENQSRWIQIASTVKVTNIGNAPAIIEHTYLGVFNPSNIDINDWPNPERDKRIELGVNEGTFFADLENFLGTNAEGHPITEIASFNLTTNNREDFFSNFPAIVGRVTYSDVLGIRRQMGFAYRPRMAWMDDLVRWGDDQYNYDKKLST